MQKPALLQNSCKAKQQNTIQLILPWPGEMPSGDLLWVHLFLQIEGLEIPGQIKKGSLESKRLSEI